MSAPTPQRVDAAADIQGTSSRFAHLIYTSLDDGSGGAGGWQVKDETGNLTNVERNALTARIVTRFDVGEPLPPFPTPVQIAARPARLVYARLSTRTGAYWHTVDAGNDATGRPGNVLAHVLLDRAIDSDPPLRPVQLWGSPGWLRPYGAADVTAAALPSAAAPQPNPAITSAAAIAFLCDTTTDRQSVFRVLLDATSAAMSGGPGVILLTADLDSGPRWISAVSHFMSPGTARRFNWSTHDDPALARADLDSGVHLVVVARNRATEIDGTRAVVIDEYEEPSIGQLGSTHHLRAGHVTVTGWSVLAEGVLADEDMAARLLAHQDHIAISVGDHDLNPVWPLAVAVRSDDELAEFHSDADHVVADDAPATSGDVGEVAVIVDLSTQATAPTTPSEALQRLMTAQRRGSGVTAAARRLMQLGLDDDNWRNSAALADVPPEPVVDVAALSASLSAVLARSDGQTPAEQLHHTLHLAELILRLGQRGEATLRALRQLTASLTAEHFLCLASTPARYIGDPAVGALTRDRILRAALPRQPEQLRSALDLATWRWLFDEHEELPSIPANPHAYDFGLLPRYAAVALEAARAGNRTPDNADRVAAEAVYMALGADDLPADECRDLVSRLGLYAHVPGTELADLFARWPDRIAPAAALNALIFQPASPRLLAAITDRDRSDAEGWDAVAVAAAQVRALGSLPQPWPRELLDLAVSHSAPIVFGQLPTEHLDRVADDLIDVIAVTFTIGQLRAETWCDMTAPTAQSLKQQLAPRAPAVIAQLADLTAAGNIPIEHLVIQGLLRRIDADLVIPGLLDDYYEGQHWTENVVSLLVERESYSGPSDPAALRDAAWPQVRTMTAAHAETFFAGYQQASRNWPRPTRNGDTDGSRWGFRRHN